MFSLKWSISLFVLGALCIGLVSGQLQCSVTSQVNESNGVITFGPLSEGSPPVDASYDPGAIGGWNFLANGFIDAVQSQPLPFASIISAINSTFLGGSQSAQSVDPLGFLQNFAGWWAGILVVTLLGILFGILFLIVGSCFWCCRCCGNCGGAKSQRTRDNNDCLTFTFAAILLFCTLILLAGAVLAFFSNEQTFRSVDNIQVTLNSVVQDSSNYLRDTTREIDDLICQFSSGQGSVLELVVGEIDNIQDELTNTINNISMEVTSLIDELNNTAISEVNTQLNSITSSLSAVNTTLEGITSNLTAVDTSLTQTIMNCTNTPSVTTECDPLIQVQTAVATALTQIPSVRRTSAVVDNFMAAISGFGGSIRDGQNALMDALGPVVMEGINSTLAEVTSFIDQTNNTFVGLSDVLSTNVEPLTNTSFPGTCPPLEGLEVFNRVVLPQIDFSAIFSLGGTPNPPQAVPDSFFELTLGYINECIVNASFDYIRQFDVYRYAIGIVICCLALITILLIWVGLLFGLLGFRKDRYPDDRSKVSHCGGIFLLVSVALTFLFGFFLLLLSGIFFFLGSNSLKLCQSLQGPNYDLFANTIDDPAIKASIPNAEVIPSISTLLRDCEQNNTALFTAANVGGILTTLRVPGWDGSIQASIEQQFDLSSLQGMIDSAVGNAASSLSMALNQSDLTNVIEMALNSIPNDTLDVSKYRVQLEEAVASADLNDSIMSLQNVSAMLRTFGQVAVADALDATAATLMSIRDDSLVTLFTQLSQLQEAIDRLNVVSAELRQNITEIANDVSEVVARVSGPVLNQFINQTVGGAVDRSFSFLDQYIAHLDDQLVNTLGGCQPVYGVYTQLHNTVCRNFLDGLNGFWWSLGFCSLLFVPVIIFAVITSSFFLRKKARQEDEDLAYPMKSY